MSDLRPGTRVWVYDEGLIALNEIMGLPTEGPAPNNTGTVSEDSDLYPESVLINFDEGGSAPYPPDAVFELGGHQQ